MISRLTVFVFLKLLRFYQLVVSPLKKPCCRFYPTCSVYARDAFLLHGPIKGAMLSFRRVLRCHPWGQSGYDPVPVIDKKGNKND